MPRTREKTLKEWANRRRIVDGQSITAYQAKRHIENNWPALPTEEKERLYKFILIWEYQNAED